VDAPASGARQAHINAAPELGQANSNAAAHNDLVADSANGVQAASYTIADACDWVRAFGVEPEHAAAIAGVILEAVMRARAVVEQLDAQGADAALQVVRREHDGDGKAPEHAVEH
jgi:hypothetical protein